MVIQSSLVKIDGHHQPLKRVNESLPKSSLCDLRYAPRMRPHCLPLSKKSLLKLSHHLKKRDIDE